MTTFFQRFSLLAVMLMITVSSYAHDGAGTTFTISSRVSLPVTVKINGGRTINISQRNYTTSTSIPNVTYIRDAHGNNCYYRHSHEYSSGKGTHHYYEITGVYSSSSSNSYESRSSSSIGESVGRTGSALVDGFTSLARSGSYISSDGYPNLQIGAGVSRSYGEFAKLRWYIGGMGGVVFYGGIGKDYLYLFNSKYKDQISDENKDQILWHAGMAMYFAWGDGRDEYQDLALGLSYGKTYLVEKERYYGGSYFDYQKVGTLNVDLDYTFFFPGIMWLGFFGGGSIGLTTEHEKIEDETFVWDVRIGVTFKLWPLL